MTTHPRRRTTRRPAKPTPAANIAIVVIVLIVAVALFQALPGPVSVLAAIGIIAFIATRRRPARRALPGGHRPLEMFQAMTPAAFEHAIAALAREDDNVQQAHVVGGANDRGADVLVQHRDGRRILIQCKRYKGPVGSEHVQIVNGTYRDIHHCDLAVIVTTAGFTGPAIETNARLRQPLRLAGGAALTAWANGGRPPWS